MYVYQTESNKTRNANTPHNEFHSMDLIQSKFIVGIVVSGAK